MYVRGGGGGRGHIMYVRGVISCMLGGHIMYVRGGGHIMYVSGGGSYHVC